MFGIGTGEVILIMVIAIMVVGPERMVDFSRTAGRLLAKFRAETDTVRQEFNEALGLDEVKEAFSQVQSEVKSVQQDLSLGLGEVKAATQEVTAAADMSTVTPAPSPFVDGETVRKPAPSELTVEDAEDGHDEDEGEDAEAIVVEVAEFVPRDEEVEPVLLDEVMLVVEEDEEVDPEDQANVMGEEIGGVELIEDAQEQTIQDREE